MRCGVIGTGALGSAIVSSIARAGFAVTVHDRDGEALASATRAGGTAAESASAVARASDVLLLVLPDSPQIFEVIDEIGAGLVPDSVVLIISTVSPETPVELGRRLAAAGVHVLDCPISGGPARAEAGDLAIMVGGDEAIFERTRPVLAAFGSRIVRIGPLGHGQIAKLANNLMGGVIIEGIAEGLAFAAKAGVDVQRVAEAIAGGSGSSWILREWVPDTVFANDYARRFSLDLMCKDMGIIRDMAAELGVPIPASDVAREAFERAVARGFGGDDFTRAIQLHAADAGTELNG
jgi:3-hydroxyisobutyrate dehydrogenase-like beta-hydroxyacid dehydrogenase